MTTLEVTDLVKHYNVGTALRRETLAAVDHVSFSLTAGRTVALVGESGSGKSTIARILARLTAPTAGTITLDGVPLQRGARAVRRYRSSVQMIFQDPFSSLNSTHTVGYHLRRPLRIHGVARTKAEEKEQVLALLRRVNLTPPEAVAEKYPYELSGGQRQRVAIARALAPRPRVLLADEPVSMLDVSIRLEILNLLDRLKAEDELAVLYITHDLATARHFSAEIMVMYHGAIVERGSGDDVILAPAHPYTRLLADAAPDPLGRGIGGRNLVGLLPRAPREASGGIGPAGPVRAAGPAGSARPAGPSAPGGCRFAPRCRYAADVCAADPPAFATTHATHHALCWLHDPQGRHPQRAAAASGVHPGNPA